uniref:Uncharacterized protein n=1 Tax=Arundo donax TaxID=35708 RepID=A0A0A9CNJ7_ARUDO
MLVISFENSKYFSTEN